MTTKSIEVTGTQPLVTVDETKSNVSVVNQNLEITVSSAVATGNTAIRNALGAVDPIWYDKDNGVFGFIDRSEVVRSEKMVDAAATPDYAGELTGVVYLDAENFDIFPILIAGEITEFDFGNIASGQTVTIICSQSTTPAQIDESSGAWSNWFWTNNNNHFPENENDTFIIKVLWTGNTYYASLLEFDTVMPDTQVGIPVGPDQPDNPEPGWLWYDTNNSLLMIYVDGAWVIAGGGGGASVHVGDLEPDNPEVGDLWFNTGMDPDTLQVYNNNQWNNSEGLQGPKGYTGSQGNQGAQGYTGSAGRAGYTGSQGDQGDVGYTGSASTVAGPIGSTGYTGSRGFNGSRGDGGYNGSRGFTGSKGDIGFTGSLGLTGSQGDTGYTGSASTMPGFVGSQGIPGFTGSQGYAGSTGADSTVPGFAGSKGDIGYSGSAGFTGSQGIQGPIGFQGSKGEDGQGVIQAEPPQDDQQYARTYKIGASDGEWELVEATGGGGDWDGVLYDKPAVIQQPTGLTDFNATTSGITIGKNGFDIDDESVIPVETGQHNNLSIGRSTYIKGINSQTGGPYKNLTLLGSNLPVGGGLSVPDNTAIIGNTETENFYLGITALIEDDSIDKYGSIYKVLKFSPTLADRDLVLTAPGSIILANNTGDPDQGIQINASRLRYRGSLLPDSTDADNNNIRREIYFDATNILSAAAEVHDVATEDRELTDQTKTWRSRRQINYISPERIRFRKFAECVNYQKPGDTSSPSYPDTTYANTDMDIDLHRGNIQHKILIDNVININITDTEWTSGTTLRNMGPVDHQPEPGTSITVILYHKDALRTITWPDNFKFLGGESELSTEASALPSQNINEIFVDNIQAIDMLHAFYDGNTWWCSITRGYE